MKIWKAVETKTGKTGVEKTKEKRGRKSKKKRAEEKE